MQTTIRKPPSFFGESIGLPDTLSVKLNQRELATVRKAVVIVEEVRDRMRDSMGTWDFETSLWYVLDAHDLDDVNGVVSWDVWPDA